jgi:periplasmic protein TonB
MVKGATCLVSDSNHILVRVVTHIKWKLILPGLTAISMTMLLFALMPALSGSVKKYSAGNRYTIQNKEIYILQPEPPIDIKEQEPLKPLSKSLNILAGPAPLKGPKTETPMASAINLDLATGLSDFKISAPAIVTGLDLGLPNIFNAGDLDHPLISVKRMPPVYPVRAKQEKIQGYVTIQFIVNTRGKVEDVTVLESNPTGIFDQSVITCASEWLFKPGAVNGEVVNTLAQTTINFELDQN